MSQYGTKQPTYTDGRTKQSFRDETDINVILKRAQKTGTVSHLNAHEARYGNFAGYDFQANMLMLTQGREIFDDLPSELRSEFNNSPAEFFNYVNDAKNKDRLGELLPQLAEPGRQNISVNNNVPLGTPREAQPNETPNTEASPPPTAETPPDVIRTSSPPPPAS